MLGVADAYELPRSPGHGYLKTGTEGLVRFKAAYVSGRLPPGREPAPAVGGRHGPTWSGDFTTHYVAPSREQQPTAGAGGPPPDTVGGDTLLDVLVRRMEGQGPPAHQVWLPPLQDPPTLDSCWGRSPTARSGA